MARKKPAKMLAVLGRCRRSGRWRVASRSKVLALLGVCHLDMRHSSIEGEALNMKVTVLLGSATFVLPAGAEVEPSGLAFLSASSVEVPDREAESDLPRLDIEWTVILGRLRIETHHEEVEEPKPETEPEPEPGPDAESEPKPEAEPAPAGIGFEDLDNAEPQPGPDAEPEPEPEAESESRPEQEPVPAGIGFEDLDSSSGD